MNLKVLLVPKEEEGKVLYSITLSGKYFSQRLAYFKSSSLFETYKLYFTLSTFVLVVFTFFIGSTKNVI